jgi:type IV secretion system protein VirD4
MGLMHAGALSRSDMRKVGRWAGISDETPEAVAVLEAASAGAWAAKIRELNGPAERTAATVRTVMTSCLSFLRSPSLAATVLPLPGQPEFDIPRLLREHGTIYLIARGDQPDTPLAGLFTALICEIAFQAVLMGSRMPGGRLDPPLFMCLDELCQVAGGVPAPSWLSDVGGQGISLAIAAHGFAQLENRYKRAGAQQIFDCSNTRIFLPGLADTETLERASKLCGHATFSRPGATTTTDELVMTPGMIRQLPPGRALFIRDGHSPVIGRVARGWEHRPYKRLLRRGLDVAPVPALAAFEPAPDLATAGNGHRSGEHPWSAK